MTRAEILDAAEKCVCGKRDHDYGVPEDSFYTISLLWVIYLRAAHPELAEVLTVKQLTTKDVGMMMALLKVARITASDKEDNYVDLAGYAACAGEIATSARGQEDE